MKILVLGASGMIGHVMFRIMMESPLLEVWGSVRTYKYKHFFNEDQASRLVVCQDLERREAIPRLFSVMEPDIIINCVGLTKHHPESDDPLVSIAINALFPHWLSDQCAATGARLIHVSTDCVFSGLRGGYSELDAPDARDVYGKSKQLGEVDYPHAVTLRTSTIGHELQSSFGLLDWFLAQKGQCRGFSRALFSGLTNFEFARVVREYVVTNPQLSGVYHVGGHCINKYELLIMIANIYGTTTEILHDEDFVIDRSLDSSRFQSATGYQPPTWDEMIRQMHARTIR